MSRASMVLVWLFAFAYTGYVVGVAFVVPAPLGTALGVPVALVLALGPIIAASIWVVGR